MRCYVCQNRRATAAIGCDLVNTRQRFAVTNGDVNTVSMTRFFIVALCVAMQSANAAAQEQPCFAVAAITPSADNEPGMVVRPRPDGYSGRKIPVIALLTSAYGLSPARIVGAPKSIERYDIEARYEQTDPAAPVPRLNVLLQCLLRQRFGLVAHVEKRNIPLYVLRIARNDGRLGPGLKSSAVTCTDAAAVSRARERNERPGNSTPECEGLERPGAFVARGVTMDVLATALRVPSGRDVVNGTALAGTWDVALEFAPVPETNSDTPSIFTAVREQLGLKLEAGRAPLDVLVIDAMTRPTAN